MNKKIWYGLSLMGCIFSFLTFLVSSITYDSSQASRSSMENFSSLLEHIRNIGLVPILFISISITILGLVVIGMDLNRNKSKMKSVDISEVVMSKRKIKGLSVNELSKLTGVEEVTINDLENGFVSKDSVRLINILKVLDVDLDEFKVKEIQ